MLSNPFVAILAAVVGLVTGFIYLWKTNEGFRDAVKNIWKNIQEFISSAAETVVKAWDSTMKFSVTCGMAQRAFSNAGTWMKEAPGNAADWVKISGTVPRNFSVDFGIQQKKAQKYMGKY